MKLIGRIGAATCALMLSVSPAIAGGQAAPVPGSALSRASVKAIGADVRVGKRMRGANNALVGLPLVLVIAAGVAATAVVVDEVAGDDSPNSP